MSSARNFINPTLKYERVVVLVDMDCFFCQVEEKLNPELKGKPVAVVQYNNWSGGSGGGIIAVNYTARDQGVTRHMRGDEAREKCPEIELVQVPNIREKADTSKYREAGKQVADVLQSFTKIMERASVDEAYLDITSEVNKRMEGITTGGGDVDPTFLINTYAVGYTNIGDYIRDISISIGSDEESDEFSDNLDFQTVRKSNFKLLIGATIAGEMRSKIKDVTGYECSAGIAHNKIMAKLVCGLNKPNKQTVVPIREIPKLFSTLPIGKIKGLGGKFGDDICELLKIRYCGELTSFSDHELINKFGDKNGAWLHQISRGVDLESVTPRFYSKSIGCCKRFPGRNAINGYNTLKHWISELSTEIVERLQKDAEENNRRPRQSVISYALEINGEDVQQSRSVNMCDFELQNLEKCILEILKKNIEPFFRKEGADSGALYHPIKFLGISTGKFEPLRKTKTTLDTFFKQIEPKVLNTEQSAVEGGGEPLIILNDSKDIPEKSTLATMFAKQQQSIKQQKIDSKEADKIIEKTKSKSSKFFNNFMIQKNDDKSATILVEKTEAVTEGLADTDASLQIQSSDTLSTFFKQKEPTVINTKQSSVEGEGESLIILNESKAIPEKSTLATMFAKQQQSIKQQKMDSKESDKIIEKTKSKSSKFFNNFMIQKNDDRSATILVEKTEAVTEKVISKGLKDASLQCSVSETMIQTTNNYNVECKEDYLNNVENNLKDNSVKDSEFNSENTIPNNQNYTHTYVEYKKLPELPPEFYIKCDKCGKQILSNEKVIQSHNDYHFAQSLRMQQQEELREMRAKSKISTPPKPPNKRIKLDASIIDHGNTSVASSQMIQNFVHVSETGQVDNTKEKCEICGRMIDKDKLVEHADYHVARKIQIEMNRTLIKTVDISKKNKSPKNNKSKLSANKNIGIKSFFIQNK